MAHPKGFTSYRHDDYKIQREFERIGKRLKGTETSTTVVQRSQPSKTTSNVIKKKQELYTGIITIDILPGEFVEGEVVPDEDMYKYKFKDYKPENGYYGWAVYKVLEHNKNLKDKNDFVYSLFDLETMNDEDDNWDTVEAEYVIPNSRYAKQKFVPDVYGLDRNRIIFRGVVKPDNVYNDYYAGNYIMPTLNGMWKDQENNIVKSNLVFKYAIKFGR